MLDGAADQLLAFVLRKRSVGAGAPENGDAMNTIFDQSLEMYSQSLEIDRRTVVFGRRDGKREDTLQLPSNHDSSIARNRGRRPVARTIKVQIQINRRYQLATLR